MTSEPKKDTILLKPNLRRNALLAVLVGVAGSVATFLYMALYVFPLKEIVKIDIPSKTGGDIYFWRIDDLFVVSAWVFLIVAIVTVLVSVLITKRKDSLGLLATVLAIMITGFYSCLLLGNAFANLMEGWTSILGVLLGAAVSMAAIVVLALALNEKSTNPNKKP